jgi:hypothetical protein
MKRLLRGIAVTAALGFLAGPVSAADMSDKTAPLVVLALYNWSGSYVETLAQVGHAKTAKRLKHVKRAAPHRRALKTARTHRRAAVKAKVVTNRPALGLGLLGEDLRVVVLQERLRRLCEVEKTERLSADSWRATCAKGGAFVVKIYPDGFMSLTRF